MKSKLHKCLPVLVLVSICQFLCHVTAAACTFIPQEKDYNRELVTINVKRVSINDILKEIKRQTGFAPFISKSTRNRLNEKVDLHVENRPLKEVLEQLLGSRYTFVIGDNEIAIRLKKPIPPGLQDSAVVKTIAGIVTDTNKNPLASVTVMVKGSLKGTSTDANGHFILGLIKMPAILQISSIGYEKQELTASGQPILIRLAPSTDKLDETVVTAYNTTTRRMNAGNIAIIKAEDMEMTPVNNPMLALQGRVPGLSVEQANGLAGAGITARIQLENSLKNGNDPLYVVDGIPYPAHPLYTLSNILGGTPRYVPSLATLPPGGGSLLSFINPSDIESIAVLKDANATSIYGSRGGNGVICITTKKGKAGRVKVDLSLKQGISTVTRYIELLNSQQYLDMRKEAYANAGQETPTTPAPDNFDLTYYSPYKNTNWQRYLIGNMAMYTDANATVSGGTNNTQFLLSTGYRRESTVFPGSLGDQRGSVHFNVMTSSANQRFKISFTQSYMLDNNQLIAQDLTQLALRLAPNLPDLYLPDGKLNWGILPDGTATFTSPLAYLEQLYTNKTANLITSTIISYEILPGLNIRSNFGYNNLVAKEMLLLPQSSYAPQDRESHPSEAKTAIGEITTWIAEPQIDYNRNIGGGKLDLLIGVTFQGNTAVRNATDATGYPANIQLENINAAADTHSYYNTAEYKYNAVFTRLSYNWRDRYQINLSARRDGSSRFGPASRFHNFGSIAGAWIFSEAQWIKQHMSCISFGKLKSSYGTTGNDAIGDYQFMNFYTQVQTPLPYQGVSGLEPSSLTNPYLQWERTKKFSTGLELAFFHDRISLEANYYRNFSDNQLLGSAVPIVAGFPGITQNINAAVLNTGWELTVGVTSIRKQNFEWSTRLNLTIPRSKLLAYPELAISYDNSDYIIGQSINIRKLYRSGGVDPVTGRYRIYNSEGKVITAESAGGLADRTAYLDLNPKFYGGINHVLKYRSLELNILLQFVKQIGANYSLGVLPGTFYGGLGNQPAYVLNRWRKPGDITPVQKVSSDRNDVYASAFGNIMASTAAFSDASYIRLKDISLKWNLPQLWRRGMHLRDAYLFLEGHNLLTITPYKGLDPETRNNSALPPLKTFTAGVKISF